MMNNSSTTDDFLVRWKFNSDEWGNFARYELKPQLAAYHTYRNWFFVVLSASLSLIILIILFSYLVIGTDFSDEAVYGPVGGILVLTPIPLLLVGIFWLMARHKINQLL